MAKKANKKYVRLRLGLLNRGLTLRRWALQNGFAVGSIYNAAAGRRNGVEALKIRRKLNEALRELKPS